MSWLQLKIHTEREDAEALEDALMEIGAVSVTLEDDADQPILEPGLGETPLWDQVQLTGLFDADVDKTELDTQLAALVGTPLPDYRWEALEEKDWEREWMGQYHPIRCGERLWICPSWIEPPEPDKINILLDPGLAFGTGTHPTTFLCMQWLDSQPLAGKNLIDYGCGSGILGIAALKLGATHVDGVDIDPQALTATEENARRNGLEPGQMPVYLPEEAPAEPADVVLANILAGPLVELAGTMADLTRPGGQICLSGILSHQAEEVMDAYERWFSFDPVTEQDDWVRLSATRLS